MYQQFEEDIRKMNAMYKLAPITNWAEMTNRIVQFNDILNKECAELDDVEIELAKADDENNAEIALSARVMMADLLGDIIVYCASEAQRWNIPLGNVLQLIMLSNQSKLGADGEPIINPSNGKFEKGPNYWKPEPAIEHMLTEVPKGGQVVVLEDAGFPTLLLLNKQQWEEFARDQEAQEIMRAQQEQARQTNLGDSANDNQPSQG